MRKGLLRGWWAVPILWDWGYDLRVSTDEVVRRRITLQTLKALCQLPQDAVSSGSGGRRERLVTCVSCSRLFSRYRGRRFQIPFR